MKFAAVLVLVLFSAPAWADTFTLGNAEIMVPPPQGFVRVTGKAPPQMDDDMNDTLAIYAPQADPSKSSGSLRSSLRSFVLKVDKKRRHQKIAPSEFDRVTEEISEEDRKTLKETEEKLPDFLNKTAGDPRVVVNSAKISLLPPHLRTANTYAVSALLTLNASANGRSQNMNGTTTATILDVSGKVIYLCASAPGQDLEWARSASRQWAADILRANAGLSRDSYQESAFGLASFGLGGKAPLYGLFIVLLIALILVSKRKHTA